jgi:biotin carboxyl carrier protein
MNSRLVFILVGIIGIAAFVGAGWWGWRQWQRSQQVAQPESHEGHDHGHDHDSGGAQATLSKAARKNLNLVSKPLALSTYWRMIEVPGVIVDRPGVSDRGVVAPIAGTVTQIHALPGSTVAPSDPLFTIRLVSESLHTSQLELHKAMREIEIATRQRQRLNDLAESGAIAKSRIIDLDNQIERAQATVDAYRQDLQARGLPADRIDAAARGEFVTEMVVRAPAEEAVLAGHVRATAFENSEPGRLPFSFELQSLNVQLGEQVEAGHVLCHLADHRRLLIEGRGFNDDLPLIQQAAKNGWPVEIEVEAAPAGGWPALPGNLQISHLSNTVDHETHTFAFFVPLENQWQTYTQEGHPRLLWRFRPGNHVRLRVPVEKLENVFVVPRQAVVREGPEAYVFRQNGDLFARIAVHVLHEERQNAVLANDGAVGRGAYIAQSGAASINRVLKAQAASGTPAGVHVHADGTVHGAH